GRYQRRDLRSRRGRLGRGQREHLDRQIGDGDADLRADHHADSGGAHMSVEASHMVIPISADRTRRGGLRVPNIPRSILLSALTVAMLLAPWTVVTEMGRANELFLPKPQ